MKRSKAIMKILDDTYSSSENDTIEILHTLLNTINNKHNDIFFNFVTDKGCCTKNNSIIGVDYWNTMAKAGNLHITQ